VLDVHGRWLVVDKALSELTGWTREELLATTFQQLTHPDEGHRRPRRR
jgi:two-component system sensor histidine kinase UhpB